MNISSYYTKTDLHGETTISEISPWNNVKNVNESLDKSSWNSVYFITPKSFLSRAIWVVKEWLGCVGIKLVYDKTNHILKIANKKEPSIEGIKINIYNKRNDTGGQIFVVENTSAEQFKTIIYFEDLLNGRSIGVHLINITSNPICFLNNNGVAFGRILGQGFDPVLCTFNNDKINEFIDEITILPDAA